MHRSPEAKIRLKSALGSVDAELRGECDGLVERTTPISRGRGAAKGGWLR